MANERFGLIGGKEVQRNLRKLAADVQQKIARRASNAGAQIVKARAVARIIASPSVDTGELRENVIVKRVPESTLTSEHIVTVRTKKATHAALVEFGTVNMPAEPYLRPALEQGRQEAAQAMVNQAASDIAAAAGSS